MNQRTAFKSVLFCFVLSFHVPGKKFMKIKEGAQNSSEMIRARALAHRLTFVLLIILCVSLIKRKKTTRQALRFSSKSKPTWPSGCEPMFLSPV